MKQTYIVQIAADGERIVDAAGAVGLDAKLPTAPEWVMRDLLLHLGGVHRWASRHLREAAPEIIDEELEQLVGGWPADDDLPDWFELGYGMLIDTLTSAPPDLQCATFLINESPLMFWTRRQAHETAIHRVDAQTPTGTVDDFLADFAADGIDELLTAFITRSRGRLRSEQPVTLVVACDDVDRAWTVRISSDPVVTERQLSEANCVVRGTASNLYRSLWNRGGEVRAEGDESLLDQFRDQVQVTW